MKIASNVQFGNLSNKLGLMKNIDIWPGYMGQGYMGQIGPQNTNYSINGHTFFGHNAAIF